MMHEVSPHRLRGHSASIFTGGTYVAAYRSLFLGIKVLDPRSSKQNGHLIDERRSMRENRFATDDRATNKETVGLSDSPPELETPPNPEVDRFLELRCAPPRARVGVVGPEACRASVGSLTSRVRVVRDRRYDFCVTCRD